MKEVITYLQKHYQISTLGDVTWAHAVNSKEKLSRFLHDPQTMMLEADIRISPRGDAVVAHPPAVDSDLRFEELLAAMVSSKQGIKFDFKDPEILIPCLTKLQDASLQQPVYVNGDILQGNRGFPPKFSAVGFLALCKDIYPEGILSIGWTTHSGPDAAYTKENVDEMLSLCQDIEHATFPIRASLLPYSWKHLVRLIEREGYSLTIWNAEPVETDLFNWMRDNVDPAKAFYDLSDENKNPVRFRLA